MNFNIATTSLPHISVGNDHHHTAPSLIWTNVHHNLTTGYAWARENFPATCLHLLRLFNCMAKVVLLQIVLCIHTHFPRWRCEIFSVVRHSNIFKIQDIWSLRDAHRYCYVERDWLLPSGILALDCWHWVQRQCDTKDHICPIIHQLSYRI